jgi:hypothetical protein
MYFSKLIVLGLAPRSSTLRLDRYLWNENLGGEILSPVLSSKKQPRYKKARPTQRHGNEKALPKPTKQKTFLKFPAAATARS